jgi:hypothetical protein
MERTFSFTETVICGLIATFMMSMLSFLSSGIGLPVIDVGYMLKVIFNHIHEQDPYSILWGNAAYYIGGILLALIWVAFLDNKLPGNWLMQGIIYGVLISIVAAVIVSPAISMAGGESFGIFYIDTWFPVLNIFAGLIMHLGYGITLLLCLEYSDRFSTQEIR